MATDVNALVEALTQAMTMRAQPTFDQRSVGKPEHFSGKDTDWSTWCFVTRPLLESIHPSVEGLMLHAETATPTDILLSGFSPENKELARKIYILLVPCCKGKALAAAKRNREVEWIRPPERNRDGV